MKSGVVGIIFGFISLIIKYITTNNPQLVENYYSNGLYQSIRWFFRETLGRLPAPGVYLVLLLVMILIVLAGLKILKSSVGWKKKLGKFTLSFFGFLGWVVFSFLLCWGYNYDRVSIEEHLGIKVPNLGTQHLFKELEQEGQMLIKLRANLELERDSLLAREVYTRPFEKKLNKAVQDNLKTLGYKANGQVRGRILYPQGIFMHFSSAGLYFPFSGEGNVDAGLHPLQIPYVMAHEMNHGYGFGDEGVCNFLAYLSCIQSEDPYIAYSGHLGYFREIAGVLLMVDREGYREYRKSLPQAVQQDLDDINETLRKYRDWMPRLRYAAYDQYLKAQGIEEGMENYSRVIALVYAWRKARSS